MAREFESIVPKVTAHKNLHSKSNTIPPANSLKVEMFSTVRLIGQLDKKFILAMVEDEKLLVIFDQHAVHERIRLEKLCEGTFVLQDL